MYFYHSMFDLCHGQCAIWLKLLQPATSVCHFVASANGADFVSYLEKVRALLPRLVSWRRWVIRFVGLLHWFALLASLRCIVCLLGLLLCACFRLSLPLLGFFCLLNWHPFWFVFVPAEGNRFALGTGGDKVVSSCWPVLSVPKLCFKPFRNHDSKPTPFNPFPALKLRTHSASLSSKTYAKAFSASANDFAQAFVFFLLFFSAARAG